VPKFHRHRVSTRQPTRRQRTLDETAEESRQHENTDVELKRAPAPLSQTLEKTDEDTSPDECVIPLSEEQPSESSDSVDGDNLTRGYLEKARGKLPRQHESIL